MKKLFYLLSLLCLTFSKSFGAEPSKENVFVFEEEQISSEFGQLAEIEKFVEKKGLTLNELQLENPGLLDKIELNTGSSSAFTANELPEGIPAFWWGCVLNVIGVFLVYILTDRDMEETRNAFIGCLVFAGVFSVFALFRWVF